MADAAVTVVVADDEAHAVDYLRTVLHLEGFVVVGEASDASGAIDAVSHLHPDVVILDLHMPGGGMDAARMIASMSPGTRVLIHSATADEAEALALLQEGIHGYVLKGTAPDRLAEAVRAAARGDRYLVPEVGRVAVEALAERLRAEHHEELLGERRRNRITGLLRERPFTTVFQPIVELATRRPMALDALSRASDGATRGVEQWLDEAASVGMRESLEIALAAAALQHLDRLPAGLRMGVRVSPATAAAGRLHEVLVGRAPCVIIELTDPASVDDPGALRRALAPWRDEGALVAVDDRGAGYVGLRHVLELEPDIIRIDAAIVRNVQADERRQAMARVLAGYAEDVGAISVAEGIEHEVEATTLAELGVRGGQGFHLGRPRPLDEQEALLAGPEVVALVARAR